VLNKFYEKPARNEEHNCDADKQDIHGVSFRTEKSIYRKGIKLLLRMGAKTLKFHKDVFM